jgi:hypothetical protein
MVDTQAVTVRLPGNIHDALRRESYETRQSMNEIIIDSLRIRAELDDPEKYGQLCSLFEAAWHHAMPDSLDDLAPLTSTEARKLAMLAIEVISA